MHRNSKLRSDAWSQAPRVPVLDRGNSKFFVPRDDAIFFEPPESSCHAGP
jgi:hypothetical protein